MSPSRLVGSYPTFSPLPRLNEAVVFFYVNPAVTDTLHINKRDALCCPDFPHTPDGASDRPSNCFLSAKILQTIRKNKKLSSQRAKAAQKPTFTERRQLSKRSWSYPFRNAYRYIRYRVAKGYGGSCLAQDGILSCPTKNLA